jgi:HSP20 family protein
MKATTLALMHDHVRAIYRAARGVDPKDEPTAGERPAPSFQEVARRFSELEGLARSIPSVAARVPAFSFTPPLDLIGTERDLVLELGVPGVERDDVDVELGDGEVIVSGARAATESSDGRIYFHAEMPRGPFRRAVRIPEPTNGSPRVEVEHGIIRVTLSKLTKTPLPRA